AFCRCASFFCCYNFASPFGPIVLLSVTDSSPFTRKIQKQEAYSPRCFGFSERVRTRTPSARRDESVSNCLVRKHQGRLAVKTACEASHAWRSACAYS